MHNIHLAQFVPIQLTRCPAFFFLYVDLSYGPDYTQVEALMLERDRPVPLYYQLELHLREAIETGKYPPGARIPTESELSRGFGVSRVTVREALRRLEEDGLLSRSRGQGTFVLPEAVEGRKIERNPARLLSFEQDILRHGLKPRVQVLGFERCPAPDRIGALLHLPAGQEVMRVRRLGWAGDEPLWVESRYFHPRIGDSVAEQGLAQVSVTAFLHAVVGVHIANTRLRITACAATASQAKHLGIKPGDPVLINEFAFYGSDGRPVEAARASFRADRYAFTFEAAPSIGTSELALQDSGVDPRTG